MSDLVDAAVYSGEVTGQGSRVLVAKARLRAAYTVAKSPKEKLGGTDLLLGRPNDEVEAQAEAALVELGQTIDRASAPLLRTIWLRLSAVTRAAAAPLRRRRLRQG